MKAALTHLLRLVISLVALTAIGQFHIKGRSLESRYHEAVNSHGFQKVFWVVARPVTWTSEKVQELYREQKAKQVEQAR